MTINERIKKFLEYEDMNMRSFAQKAGIDYTSVFNVVSDSGRKNKPSADFLEKMKLSFDSVNMNWVIGGKGDMLMDGTGYGFQFIHDNLEAYKEKIMDPGLFDLLQMIQADMKKLLEIKKE